MSQLGFSLNNWSCAQNFHQVVNNVKFHLFKLKIVIYNKF